MEYALAILFIAVMISAILSVAPLTWPEIQQPTRRETLLTYYQRGGRKFMALLWR